MFWVALLLTINSAFGAHFEYPAGIVPDVSKVNDIGELTVFAPSVYVKQEDIDKGRNHVLEKYLFADEYHGFIFEFDELKYLLMRTNTRGSNFTGNFGKLVATEASFVYFEKPSRARNVYITLDVGYRDDIRRGDNDDDLFDNCLFETPEPTKELCDKIPKCLGVAKGTNKQCLVSYTALSLPTSTSISRFGYTYEEKLNSRAIFMFIDENRFLSVGAIIVIIVLEFAFFNYDFVRPFSKNVFRVVMKRTRLATSASDIRDRF